MSTAQMKPSLYTTIALSSFFHGCVLLYMGVKVPFAYRFGEELRVRLVSTGRDTHSGLTNGIPPLLEPSQSHARIRGSPKLSSHFAYPLEYYKGGEIRSAAGLFSEEDARMEKGSVPKNIEKPKFTERALKLGIEGEIRLRVVVGKDGLVKRATFIKRLGYGLDEEALRSIMRSTFEPAIGPGGESIEEEIDYRYKFEITEFAS